jgi:hypothetical protein
MRRLEHVKNDIQELKNGEKWASTGKEAKALRWLWNQEVFSSV